MISNIYYSKPILFSLITLIIISAYWPSLTGPLVFDDQLNIVENPGVAIKDLSYSSLKTAFLSNHSGLLKRVLPALSFGINYYFAEGFNNTYVFKITNLLIHIVNTALVFWLAFLLLSQLKKLHSTTFPHTKQNDSTLVWMAALIALIWGLHPIQMTSVAYVVQRMTSMAGTFVLLGLGIYIVGRNQLEQGSTKGLLWMVLGIVCGTILGLMCKENAVLLLLYAGTIEFTLYNRQNLDHYQKKQLYWFYLFLFIIPVFIGLFYSFIYPGLLSGYSTRPFSLSERLFTEARILWFYLSMLFVPDITSMGLFHDDISMSTNWLSPLTTLLSILFWIILIFYACFIKKRFPIFTFAVFWYLLGHSMESTFIPLELIFEHRNYLPVLGPIILFCYLIFQVFYLSEKYGKLKKTVQTALWLGVISVLFYSTLSRAGYWQTENGFIASTARNHPFSPNSQYLYGELLYKKAHNLTAAYPFYYRAAQLQPEEVGFLISLTMATPVDSISDLKKSNIKSLADPENIADLLKNKPVSAWGIRALDVSARCVKLTNKTCLSHIHHVRKWLTSTIDNEWLGRKEKRHFVINLFDIEIQNNLRNEALQTIIKAKNNDDFFRYHLMHADILASLGRFSESIELLNTVQVQTVKSSLYQADLSRLRQAVLKLANEKASL